MALLDSGQAAPLPGPPSYPIQLLQQLTTLVSVSSIAKTTRAAMHDLIHQIRPFLTPPAPAVPTIVLSAPKNPVDQPTTRQNAPITSANTTRQPPPPNLQIAPPRLNGSSEIAVTAQTTSSGSHHPTDEARGVPNASSLIYHPRPAFPLL
ncbi:hypothetical protein JCM11251_000810 [Rhodosporidiobolus azoricus]